MPHKTLSQLVPEYLEFRRTWGRKAENTLRADRATCTVILRAFGDIQPINIQPHHVDRFVAEIGDKGESTYNQRLAGLRTFLEFCRARKYIPVTFDPIPKVLLDYRTVDRPERRRVPVTRFAQLLDSTDSPRDRAFLALGLYLFLRGGEIATLKVKDLSLDNGELHVRVHKSRINDVMPISAELDEEMRRWLKAYQEEVGVLGADMYLVPRRYGSCQERGPRGQFLGGGPRTPKLLPYKPITTPQVIVQKALRAIDFPTDKEGAHTLRRSGARAFFDSQVDGGYDGALRKVQAMLHHKHVRMTEHYIGLEEDRYRRDAAVKGQRMFGSRDNVVTLTSVHRASGG